MTSHDVVVQTITSTTTRTGLRVHAQLDPGTYPTGLSVSDHDMSTLSLKPHHWHGEWNYTLPPEAIDPPPSSAPARVIASDHAPDWLADQVLTGMSPHDFTQLLAALTDHLKAHPPESLTPRSYEDTRFGDRLLSVRDPLLITLITRRWSTRRSALATILGVNARTVARALHETTLDLTHLGQSIAPAPMKATTTEALLSLTGAAPEP